MIEILNLKLVIILEYENIKIFLQKLMVPIGLKEFLWLNRLKTLCRGHMLLVILKGRHCWNILQKRIVKKNSKRV